jgi:hypothetical protein
VRPVDQVIVVVFDTVLSEAVPQPLSKGIYLTLGLLKCVVIVTTVLLTSFRLESSVTSGKDTSTPCTSLRPLSPESERLIRGKLRSSFRDHMRPRDGARPGVWSHATVGQEERRMVAGGWVFFLFPYFVKYISERISVTSRQENLAVCRT